MVLRWMLFKPIAAGIGIASQLNDQLGGFGEIHTV